MGDVISYLQLGMYIAFSDTENMVDIVLNHAEIRIGSEIMAKVTFSYLYGGHLENV